MPDYTTDERWRRGPRKHTARRGHVPQVGTVIRCEGCDYEPIEGTVREQEDAHRAHRVAMGENVKAQRVLPRGVRLKQAEAERDRYRSAWQSARQRAVAYREGILRHVADRDDWKGWMHEQAARAEKAEAEVTRLAATLAEIDREHTALTRREIAVRDYCTLTLDSCRVQAREVAQDVLRLLDGDGKPSPKDTGQLRFIHDVLKLAQDGDFRSQLFWHSDGEQVTVSVDVSDVFAWGCADCEEITPERLPVLAQAMADLKAIHRHDATMYTVDLYAARIRQMRPQGAAYPKERAATQALFDACGPERATGLGNPRKPPTPTEES